MKKRLLKAVAVILAVVLAIPAYATPVKAAANWDNVPETHYASRYTSSYYTYGKFYDNLTKVPLTGDGARDVVAVAATQMGYIEGDSSYGHDGVTGGSSNYTEFGAYTAVDAAAWCASFCSWVFWAAEVTDTRGTESYMARNGYYWSECYVPYWSSMLMDEGRYRYSISSQYDGYGTYQETYIPQPGDLVFFYTGSGDYPGEEGHIGLVAYSDGSYVYTLEGNTSSQDGVESEGGGAFFKKYAIDSSSLIGYGVMPYETVDGLPEIDYSGENPTTGLYVATSGAKSVYLDIEDSTASWTLPMSSVFEVLDIDTDSLGNTMLYSKCEIDGETIYGWILHGSGSNGNTRTFQIYSSYEDPNDQNHDGIPDSYNHTVNADGSYSFENVYGHSFYINDVNGIIDGEDATLITSSTAYASANPNWAISVQLRPTGNGTEYEVVKVVECPQTSDAAAAGITFEDGDVVMVVHSAASYPGYSNWKNKVAALTLEPGDIVNISADNKYVTVPAAEDSEDSDEPSYEVLTDVVRYQTRNDKDVRFIAYVDVLEKYSSVAFVLTIDGRDSNPLVCTTAYHGLTASGVTKTTQDIYEKDGFFVTYTVNNYLDYYAGKEITVTVTYTLLNGDTFTDARTMTIGSVVTPDEPEEEIVIESVNLTYANDYDWTNTSSQIYVFASSDATATPQSIVGQGNGFMQWWTGIVFEYNSANDTWEVTEVYAPNSGAEDVTLGDNKFVVIFHSDAATGNTEKYNFFTKYGVVGTELYLSGTLSKIQSTTGSLMGVSLATGIVETVLGEVPDYGGAIAGAGLQGYTSDVAYGCDISFWNVNDTSYAYGSTLDDSGADYSLVDFDRMKADGCDFVILRIGSVDSSGNYYDPHFVTLYNMAREAGMDIGLYFYSDALTYAGAVAEAEFVISVIEAYDMYFEYPLYIDIEESDQLALGTTGLDNLCYGWCETMIEAGYFPGIYGNYNLYEKLSSDIIDNYDFWLAYVSSSTSMSTYNPNNMNLSDECSMWQYSFYGYEYDGIGKEMLDVNVSYKDYPSIIRNGGYNNVK